MTAVPAPPEQRAISRLAQFGAATVYEANGQFGAVDAGIKPLDTSVPLAGRAMTLDLAPADNWYIHVALLEARPGDVLVIDAKGYREAGPWGDVLTCAAQQRGLAGLIIDGAVRDSRDIIASGFPVFARGLSIKGTTKALPGRINVPVQVGGVTIAPGDIVIGDADGLVCVTSNQLQDVVAASETRADKEATFRDRLRAGDNTVNLLGLPDPR